MNSDNARFILVTRRTRMEELVERFNTWPQAKFYLEHNNVDAGDYLVEHDVYQKQILRAEQTLQPLGRLQRLDRSFLPSYQFARDDIVVVIGQDGLVANTLKYLDGQPVVAINPDPDRWEGVLLPFIINELSGVIKKILKTEIAMETITLAEAITNDRQSLFAVNDLFIGPAGHTSARYNLTWQGRTEAQSSSGIIVSTGFGSTGWLRSIVAGACGIAGTQPHELANGFAWHEPRLQFSVREPFPSKTSGTKLVFGAITRETPLAIESHIPENGVIFSDGIQDDYIAFNSGSVVSIRVADKIGRLVMKG